MIAHGNLPFFFFFSLHSQSDINFLVSLLLPYFFAIGFRKPFHYAIILLLLLIDF